MENDVSELTSVIAKKDEFDDNNDDSSCSKHDDPADYVVEFRGCDENVVQKSRPESPGASWPLELIVDDNYASTDNNNNNCKKQQQQLSSPKNGTLSPSSPRKKKFQKNTKFRHHYYQIMALTVKVSKMTGVTEGRGNNYYLTLDFKSSLYKSNPMSPDGDCLKINQVFSWPLGTPLQQSDMLSIKFYQSVVMRSDRYLSALPISLEQVIAMKRIEVDECFVNAETNQPTTHRIEMEIIYTQPGEDDSEEAMQRALLQQVASQPDDNSPYQGGDHYDSISVTTASSTPDGKEKKKKGFLGLKSKFGLKGKAKTKDSDALSEFELEPMIVTKSAFHQRRSATVATSASDPELCFNDNYLRQPPPTPSRFLKLLENKDKKSHHPRKRSRSPRLQVTIDETVAVTSKSSKSMTSSSRHDGDDGKFEAELAEMPSADFISHRKRIDRLYRCRNYEALQTRSFQVHVTIIEARQLSGSNIDPVVSVTVGEEKKSTAVKTSTNCPYFNEFMLFDVRMPQQALFDQVINVSVLHSKKLLSDEMIGQFRVDVATIYRYPDHTIGHKWVQLADPSDLCSPPKGFLKLCISIVAKGEIAAGSGPPVAEGEDDNIEKNLFTMGAGSSDGLWQTARYNVRIYQAEQLPSASSTGFVTGFSRLMKSNDAALLDPFALARFAGQMGKTTVKKATTNPEWNEQISFIDMFPPPCRRLAVQVRDSGLSDNLIACHYVDLYTVSNEGKHHTGGYLPVYGPCWVNLYGAVDTTDETATRFGEGQAYRGRLLIELHTELLDNPEPTAVHVINETCSPCDKSLLPVKNDLLLMCGIHNVDMIPGYLKEKPVHLQLSLGPYPEIVNPAEIQAALAKSKGAVALKDDVIPLLGGVNEKGEPDKVVHVTPALAVKPADGDFGCIPLQGKKPLLAVHYAYEDQRKQATTVNMLEKIASELDEGHYRAKQALKLQNTDLAVAITLKALKGAISRCNTFTRLSKSTGVVGRQSRLFENWLKQTRDALTEIVTSLSRIKSGLSHHTVHEALTTVARTCGILDTLLLPREQDFPEAFIWLVSSADNRKLAFAKLPMRSLHFSEVPEECGIMCGKLETFKLLAPDRTNAHLGNITISAWHGLHKDWFKAFELLPRGVQVASSSVVPSSLTFKHSQKFQLRAYLYQARGIRGLDDTGLSDPFAVVHVQSRSSQSRVINETLSPIWDETLVLSDVEVYGSSECIRDRPPVVTLNIYDYDTPDSCELIGVAYIVPIIKFNNELSRYVPPQLQWFKLISPKTFAEAGEVLTAVEMLQHGSEEAGSSTHELPMLDIPDDLPSDSPMPVPRGIRPTLSRYRIEILFWGLRELSRVQLLTVDRPRLDIELSGQVIQSDVIQNAQTFPNFACLIKAIEMDLPDNDIFCPPLMIRCVDCRSFGRQLLVGAAAVPNISAFFVAEVDESDKKEALNASTAEMDDSTSLIELNPDDSTAVQTLAKSSYPMLDPKDVKQEIEMQQVDGYMVPSPGPLQSQSEVDETFLTVTDEFGGETIDDRGLGNEKVKPRNLKKYQRTKIRLRLPPREDDGGMKPSSMKTTEGGQADSSNSTAAPMAPPPVADEEETDWWTKYYATVDEVKKAEMEASTLAGKTLMTGGIAGGKSNKLKLFKRGKTKSLSKDKLQASPGSYDNVAFQADDTVSRLGEEEEGKLSKSELKRRQKEENNRILKIYQSELETTFQNFEDFVRTFELNRGKEDEDADAAQRRSHMTGKFKGNFRVSRLSSSLVGTKPVRDEHGHSLLFQNIPPSMIVPLIVRVYVVRATDLYPKDMNGKSDPYVTIRLGKNVIKDKDNYVSKQLNPVFGRCFDLKATLPFDNMLTVQVYDWDLVGSDELIGETKIDIESRFYSKYRPTCGLPLVYEKGGYNTWRDSSRPTQLLGQMCRREGLEPPIFENGKVIIGKRLYQPVNWVEDIPDGNEHLALGVLNNWDKVAGHKLVPEHTENRLLFDPAQPGQVMGHLEMWVDMFPSDKGNVPPPIDISPRKPKGYELRCIIWNTEDVILDDVSITGEKMSDIYVKGYITGPEDTQQTDVHYRSLTGEGNFNWRFVFKFDYLSCEQKIVVKRKETLLSWDESEEKLPARLTLQVWDADLVGADDFLGSLTLDLNNMPRGAKDAKDCFPDMVAPDGNNPMTSLFKQRRMRGFWPFTVKNENTQELELTGKVEAEFQLLTAEEAATRPAGLGRDPPDAMEKPNRPDTSFLWFTNPFKSLRYILCTKFKWLFIKILIIAAFAAILVLFLYSLPGWIGKKIIGV